LLKDLLGLGLSFTFLAALQLLPLMRCSAGLPAGLYKLGIGAGLGLLALPRPVADVADPKNPRISSFESLFETELLFLYI